MMVELIEWCEMLELFVCFYLGGYWDEDGL